MIIWVKYRAYEETGNRPTARCACEVLYKSRETILGCAMPHKRAKRSVRNQQRSQQYVSRLEFTLSLTICLGAQISLLQARFLPKHCRNL
jgi:hypothetical protein